MTAERRGIQLTDHGITQILGGSAPFRLILKFRQA
jgi:hypothetical protein